MDVEGIEELSQVNWRWPTGHRVSHGDGAVAVGMHGQLQYLLNRAAGLTRRAQCPLLFVVLEPPTMLVGHWWRSGAQLVSLFAEARRIAW